MWKRKCPLCFVWIPWTATLAHSYEITCPACHAPLELSRITRIFGAFGGVAGALVALYLGHEIFQGRLWGVPVVSGGFWGLGSLGGFCVAWGAPVGGAKTAGARVF